MQHLNLHQIIYVEAAEAGKEPHTADTTYVAVAATAKTIKMFLSNQAQQPISY